MKIKKYLPLMLLIMVCATPFAPPAKGVDISDLPMDSLVKAALDSSGIEQTPTGPVGKVLVVDGGGSLRRALLGGNLGSAAARNGWAGVVIDGCVRDVAELAALSVGIRALASLPLPTDKRNEGQKDLAVRIQGVWVRPGDWLYADEDGMLVSAQRLL